MQVSPLGHLRRNAVAYLALFVALGGTSFAAATVITGKNVKNSSLTGADVKNSSLTGGDVKNKSLTASDFDGSVQGPKGDTGPQGANGDAGLQGARGETGVQGERGPSNAWVIELNNLAGAVALPAGKFVFTGAVSFTGGGGLLECSTSHFVPGQPGYPTDGKSQATAANGVAASLPVGGTFQQSVPGFAWVNCGGSGTNLDMSVTVIQVAELDDDFAVAGRTVCTQHGGTFAVGGPFGYEIWTCSGVSYTAERETMFRDACKSDSPVIVFFQRNVDGWSCSVD